MIPPRVWLLAAAGPAFVLCSAMAQAQTAPAASPADAPAAPPAASNPPPAATVGPVSITGVAVLDSMSLVAGGVHPGSKILTKAAVSASYDGSNDGHEGLSALASMQFAGGGHISANNIGDIQVIDNIEASNALRIYEVWIAHQYGGGKFGWKAGLTDLNADFDTQQVASLFINSSDGTGAELGHSGLNGPSIFPTTALAISGFARIGLSTIVRAGLFDGTSGTPYHPGVFAIRVSGLDGALFIAQVEKTLPGGVRLVGGAWTYTSLFGAQHSADAAGNPIPFRPQRGAFGLVEGTITHMGDDGERGLSAWARLGTGDPVIQRISGYIGAGLVFTGPIAKRAGDQIGLSINRALVEQPIPLPIPAPDQQLAETAFELTYKYNAKDWLAIQPDAQMVIHPNGDPAIPTAFVIGIRFSLTLTKSLFGKLGVKGP
ncbi:carbohydrate porin [Novosphingobium sp.]|uniref:carbohydrate porin n=1 Tax=Novosphingobium sp. TaxID=1874826 RepID=UPI003D0A835A